MTEIEALRLEVQQLRQKAVDCRNHLRLFDNSSGFVAFMKGPRFIYTYVNEAHKRIVRNDFTGKSILDVAPQAHNLHGVLKKVYDTGVAFIHHMQPVTIDGQPHFMNANYVATKDEDGIIDGVMAWGIDITEEVMANKTLKAERSLRERFVMALTHDLRTPLTSMKLTVQMMERKVEDVEYVKMSSQRILKSINHSERMILNLLDANRIQLGEKLPHKKSKFSFEKIIEEVIGDQTLVQGSRFDFQNQAGHVEGFWDPTGIRRVTENLLENAVKYGFLDSKITVSLSRTDSEIQLKVHNHGIPIAKIDQTKIFIPYERTDSAQVSDQRGWGLGLALVKAILETHEGSISVESEKDIGTTFVVRLPISIQD